MTKGALSLAYCLFLGLSSLCFGGEPPAVKAVLDFASEQYQSGTFVWHVLQTISHDKDEFRADAERLAEQARKLPDGPEKNNLLVTKKSLETLGEEKINDEVVFTASFLNGGRFNVTERFVKKDNSGEEIQYFCDGDGLTYTVRDRLKRVTISDKPAEIIRLLLRSRVDLFLREKFSAPGPPRVETSGDQLLFSIGNGTDYDLVATVDSDSHKLRSVVEKSNGVVLQRYSCSKDSFPGTTLPATVTYEEFKNGNQRLSQIWELKKADFPIDPTTIGTDYRLKPRYTIIDITNNGVREFRSEDWLPKKSGP